ncbi:MAG: hypothetical protein IJZ62_00390, partial [Clostridia bacterium]|nr:hypothetical protein [Clostridia bacterium]
NKTYFIAFESEKEKENFIKKCPFEVERENEGVLVKVHDSQINMLTNYISNFKITKFKQIKFTLEQHFMGFYKNNKDFGGQL